MFAGKALITKVSKANSNCADQTIVYSLYVQSWKKINEATLKVREVSENTYKGIIIQSAKASPESFP